MQAVTGQRTLQEIADRLGWPLRRALSCAARALDEGSMQIASGEDALELALACQRAGQIQRARTRIQYWAACGTAGPMPSHAAQEISSKIGALVHPMPSSPRRTILRRLHATLQDPGLALQHWKQASESDPLDRIAHLHSVRPRLRRQAVDSESGTCPMVDPPVAAWLELARGFQDQGCPRRAIPLLELSERHCADWVSVTLQMRLELGLGLTIAGLPQRGAPWVLEACQWLVDNERAGEAISPLRVLLDHAPRHREVRRALAQARRAAGVRGLDLHPVFTGRSLVALVVGALLLSTSALVHVRSERSREAKLSSIRALSETPSAALARLEIDFPGERASDVQDLREDLLGRELLADMALRKDWIDQYEQVQHEATLGDPVQALDRMLRLPAPPIVQRVSRSWPEVQKLRDGLTQRLLANVLAHGDPQPRHAGQIEVERRVTQQIAELHKLLEPAALAPAQRLWWEQTLDEISQRVCARDQIRTALTRELDLAASLQQQETWMRQAETHQTAGRFQSAIELYEDIIRIDRTGKVESVLQERLGELHAQREALAEARRRALAGQHETALDPLEPLVQDLSLFSLPWQLTTEPAGAHVESSGLAPGTVSLSPTQNALPPGSHIFESRRGDPVQIVVSHPGYETRTLLWEHPEDRRVTLSLNPVRAWNQGAKIEAPPFPVGNGHIVCDRDGHVARLGADGSTRWSRRLDTLSGFSRSPVFMPHRPGHVLLISEEGQAWVLNVESGETEGPLGLGSAPMCGPAPSPQCISLRLVDGRCLGWTFGLKPHELADVSESSLNHDLRRFGDGLGFHVLRRREDPERSQFENPYRSDHVHYRAGAFYISWAGGINDSVLCIGEWRSIAFERPSIAAPLGRIWISDEGGLRAFEPTPTPSPALGHTHSLR